MNRCAVVGCGQEGKPQMCPFDGRYHHHGRIHYGQYPESSLTFHRNAWDLMCDEHYLIVTAERRAWEQEVRAQRNAEASV